MSSKDKLNTLFHNLWQQYTADSPQAKAIYQLFIDQGEQVQNDHIAIRTFDDPRVNVDKLGAFFFELGYKAAGDYQFPVKKLEAKHFEHVDPSMPKIFISELKTKAFSDSLQKQTKACIDRIDKSLLQSNALLYSGVLWGPLDYVVYEALLSESEYAAWVYAFGFRANHFTVFVNAMQRYNTIEKVNDLLKEHGYQLNTAGGEIKGTPHDLLEQSSTLADRVNVPFSNGEHKIPNSYYEFARRYPDQDGVLYQGFVATSADKIFESTDRKKNN